ncbi:MAG: hypothetical protein U0X39_05435 [Bacteroidales bacterium]
MEYKLINTDYVVSVAGNDNSIITELVGMFAEQVAETAIEMKKLHGEKEFYKLGLLAHKAKSSVAIMGMSELATLLKKFELQAKEGIEPENYTAYISKFEEDTKLAVDELKHFIKNLPNSDAQN